MRVLLYDFATFSCFDSKTQKLILSSFTQSPADALCDNWKHLNIGEQLFIHQEIINSHGRINEVLAIVNDFASQKAKEMGVQPAIVNSNNKSKN
jgi:hypothetical protein